MCEFFTSKEHVTAVIASYTVEGFLETIVSVDTTPTIMLLDINLPEVSGVDGIPMIKKACPELDTIMLTTIDETAIIIKTLTNSAFSYTSKRVSLKKIGEAAQIASLN